MDRTEQRSTAGAPVAGDELRRARLAGRLHFAAMRLLRLARRGADEPGPPTPQLAVLSRLVDRGPATLGDLARLEGVRPPTMTRMIQALEGAGYVARRASREDGRVAMVSATTRGWRLLESAEPPPDDEFRARLRSLEPDELRTLEAAAALIERLAVSD